MSSVTPPRNPDRHPAGLPDDDLIVRMPPTNTGLLVAACVCLIIPLVALMWVSSYAKETPRLGGIPFFFWYQFAWVFATSALTYAAHRLVIAARGESDAPFAGHAGGDRDVPPHRPLGDGDRPDPTSGLGS